jgi:predicted dienelactone hydrolase
MSRYTRLSLICMAALFLMANGANTQSNNSPPATPVVAPFGVGLARVTFTDPTRPTKATGAFAGTPDRRLDVMVWYPTKVAGKEPVEDAPIAEGETWPLVIYSHGTGGSPDNASHIAKHLARHGYVFAAAAYPLTSRVSFAKLPAAQLSLSDTGNQPKDVSFMIDTLLDHPVFGKAIDPDRIGSTGISLGAVTSYFLSYGVQTRDPRIIANAMIATADPPYAALSFGLGFDGTFHADVSVPALIFAGTRDVFDSTTGGPYAYYARLRSPKYHVMIEDAPHSWFSDRAHVPADGKNPDCGFFEANAPDMVLPLCEERGGLIDPMRQKAIVQSIIQAFFDAYLKGEEGGLEQLRGAGDEFPEVKLVHED